MPVTWEVPSPHYTTTAAEAAAASPHFPLKWLFVHITRGAGGTLTGCLIIILIESHQLTQMARGNPESYKFHQSKRQTFKIWLEGSTYSIQKLVLVSSRRVRHVYSALEIVKYCKGGFFTTMLVVLCFIPTLKILHELSNLRKKFPRLEKRVFLHFYTAM